MQQMVSTGAAPLSFPFGIKAASPEVVLNRGKRYFEMSPA
jgi:hypothetical protein